MSKFLTPPVWYDKNGEENQSLVNTAGIGIGGPVNIAFGLDAKSGADGSSHSCIAIGYEATATGSSAIAIGSYDSEGSDTARAIGSEAIAIGGGASAANGSIAIGNAAGADFYDSIAIGRGAVSTTGGIAIGAGASTTGNQIQLGNNDTAYTLNIGKNTIDPALVQDFFAGNMDSGGVSGNLYVYANLYKSGEAGSPSTGWYQAAIESVKQTVVVRDVNGKIKAADPTAANEVATKQYVDKAIDNAIAALKL